MPCPFFIQCDPLFDTRAQKRHRPGIYADCKLQRGLKGHGCGSNCALAMCTCDVVRMCVHVVCSNLARTVIHATSTLARTVIHACSMMHYIRRTNRIPVSEQVPGNAVSWSALHTASRHTLSILVSERGPRMVRTWRLSTHPLPRSPRIRRGRVDSISPRRKRLCEGAPGGLRGLPRRVFCAWATLGIYLVNYIAF